MKTKTLGEILKDARISAGVGLDELESLTRIKLVSLQALERDDFSQLPSAVFVKGYICSIARALDVDSRPLLAILRRDFKSSAKGHLQAREFLVPMANTQFAPRPIRFVVLATFCMGLVLALYVSWQWFLLNQPPSVLLVSPTELSEVGSEVSVTGRTKPEVSVLINGQPANLKPDGLFIGEVYFPKDGIANIVVEVKDRRGKKTTIERQVLVKSN